MISNLSYLASFRLVLLNNLTRLALRKYETHQNRRKYLYSFGIPIVVFDSDYSVYNAQLYEYCIFHCQGEATFAINADGVGDARD